MDTAGESPVKQAEKAHRERRSSAGQKKRDQRNEKYYPGAYALARLAQNYEQVAMLLQHVMEVSDRLRLSEESSEQVRQLLEAHRTTGQMLEERMNRT